MGGHSGDIPLAASRLIRRQRIFLIIVALAAVVSIAGLVASAFVKSPAQRAADQAPPHATVLTVPVLKEVLKTTVVIRGVIGSTSSVDVTLPTSTSSVVSALPKKVGDPVAPGQVVAQVAGRPVIALPGSVPAYRDLKPGQTGPDVAQLQAALIALGYADADASGSYGSGTKLAVTALYNHLGYDPASVGDAADPASQSLLQSAQDSVTQAQRKVDSDSAAVASALGGAAVSAARQELTYSEQDLSTARSRLAYLIGTTGVEFPQAEIVFIPFASAVIGAVNVKVGSPVPATTPLLSIDSASLIVSGLVPPSQQQLVKSGMNVQIDDDVNSRTSTGVVTNVGPFTSGTSDQATASQAPATPTPGYPLLVTPAAALPITWLGADVRLTILAASTPTEVLVVPIAAIISSADGGTLVTVVEPGGNLRRVGITVGANANGMVEVTPTSGASLAEGELVVTGQ